MAKLPKRRRGVNADFKNPDRSVQIYDGAGHLFTHEDIPLLAFFDRIFWNPFYEKEESRDAMELVYKWLKETNPLLESGL